MKKLLWMSFILLVGIVLLTRSRIEVKEESPSEKVSASAEETTVEAVTDAVPVAGAEKKISSAGSQNITEEPQHSGDTQIAAGIGAENKKVTALSSSGTDATGTDAADEKSTTQAAGGKAAVVKKSAENKINPTPPVKSADLNLDIQSEPQAADTGVVRSSDYDVSKPVYESIKEKDPFPLTHQEELLQSEARPLDMDIVAEVQASKSDPGYAQFVDKVLPKLSPKLENHFKQRKEIVDNSLEAELDDLRLDSDANVRVYFIKEGTVFQNSLGIGLEDEDKLIFPNASSAVSYFRDSTTRVEQTNEDSPMLPGDYVDLGLMKKGSLLDLFIIKDGARDENGAIYGIDKDQNPDKSNHVRIHEVVNENTLIVGFEDLPGGGDKDYNDLVIAVEIIPVDAAP